jgi:hypothetical protein
MRKRINWIDRDLEYRQGYFLAWIIMVSFLIGLMLGISIIPYSGVYTIAPALFFVLFFGLIVNKLIPFLWNGFVLLKFKIFKRRK